VAAQRHGRADSLENNHKGQPDAAVVIVDDARPVRWRAPQLAALPLMNLGSRTDRTGVNLSELIPAPANRPSVYEIHYGFFRVKRLRREDLDDTTPILVESTSRKGFADRTAPIRIVYLQRSNGIHALNDVHRVVLLRDANALR
jgi:hypothetical protein